MAKVRVRPETGNLYLDFQWRGNHWPAFNLADVAVCLGAGLVVLAAMGQKHKKT